MSVCGQEIEARYARKKRERAEWKAKREVESAVKKRMSKMYIKYGHNYS